MPSDWHMGFHLSTVSEWSKQMSFEAYLCPVERLAVFQPIGASHEVDRLGESLHCMISRRRVCVHCLVLRRRVCVVRSALVLGEAARMYCRIRWRSVGSPLDDVRCWVATGGIIALDRSHEIRHKTNSQNWTKDMHLAVHKDARSRLARQR
jgi:hypothetical protein